MIKNSPKKVSDTEYLISIVISAIMALTSQFELVDECADRFSFLYDIKKLEEMKENFKMQGMKLYCASLMKRLLMLMVWRFAMNVGFYGKSSFKILLHHFQPFSF